MSSLRVRDLHPAIRDAAAYALRIAEANGVRVTVTSTRRDPSEQAFLRTRYENCLARGERIYPGNPNPACRYPANRPGRSAHEYGLAFDSVVPEHQWPIWNEIRAWVGFQLDAGDRVHAEYPGVSAYLRSLGT